MFGDRNRTDHVPLCSSLGLVIGLTVVLCCLLEDDGLCPESDVDLWRAFGIACPPGEMGPKSGEVGSVAIEAAEGGYGLAIGPTPGEVDRGGDETSAAVGVVESRGVNLNDAAREKDEVLEMAAPPSLAGGCDCCGGC